jgi:rod shape-determining protein MreD
MGTFILPVFPLTARLPRPVPNPGGDVRAESYPQTFHVKSRHAARRILDAVRAIHGGAVISYIGPLLAVIVGIVHAAVAPVILIGDVKPNLVLIAVVLVTCLGGFSAGITFAFVGGLTANLLVSDPLGSIPLGLLVVAAVTAGGARLLGQAVWVYPILAVAIGSVIADVISLGLGQLVGDAWIGSVPTELVLGAAALNAFVGAVVLIPARMVAARYVADETAAW